MRIATSTGWIEIEPVEVLEASSPAYGDFLLTASIQSGEFAARTSCWVSADSWSAFLRDLSELERRRAGAATLASMSPDDLQLKLSVIDRLGHVAISGFVSASEYRLQFAPISLDPTDLPRLVEELSRLNDALPGGGRVSP